jgi:hypothetical protein
MPAREAAKSFLVLFFKKELLPSLPGRGFVGGLIEAIIRRP